MPNNSETSCGFVGDLSGLTQTLPERYHLGVKAQERIVLEILLLIARRLAPYGWQKDLEEITTRIRAHAKDEAA